ncbi:TIM barrel protein [Zoogloea sp.]|uniref:sugar phosphate isomerase/epimerase family protein n=1 Tax=Zoogloea sp. TaxID=49181 RepID=UPI002611DC17|nr:TIM barrel protein [Zoogloea sp.]MDD3352060.1 TIM barrel protein [Zoogloea sp.]
MSLALPLLGCYWTLAGNYVFGEADHSPWDFRLRAEAAARAGYTGIGIKQADLRRTLASHGIQGLRAILAGNGLCHLELEALFDWCADGEARQRSDMDRHLLLATAAELGAHRIKAAGDFGGADWSVERMHDAFQVLARQAREVGTTVTLEPIPFSNIPDLETALAILGTSAGQGGGLMLDSWHVTRGQMDFARIAALPPGTIGGAELDDGTLETVGSPIADTLDRRRLCGEGEFDLAGFIAAVRASGYQGPWGVEIISVEQRARPLQEAADASWRGAGACLRSCSG